MNLFERLLHRRLCNEQPADGGAAPLMVKSQQTSLLKKKSRSRKARRRNTSSSLLKAKSLIPQRWSNSSLSRVS